MTTTKDIVGLHFGRLTVIRQGEPQGAAKRKAWVCICECGEETTVVTNKLNSGKTQSCGCLRKEKVSKLNKTHGERNTRLYECWVNMKNRTKQREDCTYHPAWGIYENFRDWAKDNGYTDSLVLCRNGDMGDYSPTNCRWDTYQSNSEEALAKEYLFRNPQGAIVKVYNLLKFCRENGLNQKCMDGVYHKRYGRKSHKGWTAV